MARAQAQLPAVPAVPSAMSAAQYRTLVAGPKQSGPGAAYRALGRLKAGTMNRTEARYDAHLCARTAAGEVLWHRFEAMKLRLADRTFFDADFFVQLADRTLEVHDVKGARHLIEEDAKVKIKVAAALFPVFGFVVAWPGAGGGWETEVFG